MLLQLSYFLQASVVQSPVYNLCGDVRDIKLKFNLRAGSGERGVLRALVKWSMSSGGRPHVWGTLAMHLIWHTTLHSLHRICFLPKLRTSRHAAHVSDLRNVFSSKRWGMLCVMPILASREGTSSTAATPGSTRAGYQH